jgi:hypothetical protein
MYMYRVMTHLEHSLDEVISAILPSIPARCDEFCSVLS